MALPLSISEALEYYEATQFVACIRQTGQKKGQKKRETDPGD